MICDKKPDPARNLLYINNELRRLILRNLYVRNPSAQPSWKWNKESSFKILDLLWLFLNGQTLKSIFESRDNWMYNFKENCSEPIRKKGAAFVHCTTQKENVGDHRRISVDQFIGMKWMTLLNIIIRFYFYCNIIKRNMIAMLCTFDERLVMDGAA